MFGNGLAKNSAKLKHKLKKIQMETEKHSPKWLLNEIKNAESDAHALFKIIEFQKALTEQCNIAHVSQQRELLISFFNWYEDDPKELSNNETIVDAYIEEINCG